MPRTKKPSPLPLPPHFPPFPIILFFFSQCDVFNFRSWPRACRNLVVMHFPPLFGSFREPNILLSLSVPPPGCHGVNSGKNVAMLGRQSHFLGGSRLNLQPYLFFVETRELNAQSSSSITCSSGLPPFPLPLS